MIRHTLRLLFPKLHIKPRIKLFSSLNHNPTLTHYQKMMFCEQKKQPTSDEKIEDDKKQEEKNKKLIEMTNEQLIQLNTSQSLKAVENNIILQNKKNQEIENKIKDNQAKLKLFQQIHDDHLLKQQKLLQNIKQADEELSRIRKRMEKQIQDSKDYAITKLAKQLLEVADCLKRCRKQAQELLKTNSKNKFLQKIIESDEHIIQLLKLYDIQEFDPINEPFDPNTSESLLTIPCPPGFSVNNVATTMQTGYKIKDRLLRSARVGIFV